MIWFSNIILSRSENPMLLIYPNNELNMAKINKNFVLGKFFEIFDKELINNASKLTNIYNIYQLDNDKLYNEIHLLSYKIEYDQLDHLKSIYKKEMEYTTEDEIVLLIITDNTIKHIENILKNNKV